MKKIAIITAVGIGDIISLSPLTKKLKSIYPDSWIVLYSFNGGFFESAQIDYVDAIITYGRITRVPQLFRTKLDILIGWGGISRIFGLVYQILYYALITFLPAEKKIFYSQKEACSLLRTNVCKVKVDILKKLSIPVTETDYPPFIPYAFAAGREKIKKFLNESGIRQHIPTVIFHVGAKKNMQVRFWQTEKWIAVVEHIHRHYDANIVFIGSEIDSAQTETIMQAFSFPIVNAVGLFSIAETTALVETADFFISTNSGPMWIANALQIPQVVICSGTSKACWYPYQHPNVKSVVVRKPLQRKYCDPDHKPECNDKKCMYGDYACIRTIEVVDVINAIDALGVIT